MLDLAELRFISMTVMVKPGTEASFLFYFYTTNIPFVIADFSGVVT